MQAQTKCTLAVYLLAMIVLAGLTWLTTPTSRGQETLSAENAAASTRELQFPGGYRGSERCLRCHQGQIRELAQAQDESFVLLLEPAIWRTDPHSQAFAFIDWSDSRAEGPWERSRELSRQICEKLGIEDIHTAKQCLSCHANWKAELEQPPPLYKAGVACESCHGPSERWDGEHSEPSWRAKPVADKTAKGMVDVRNPVKRAEQCFSCHIGSVEQGKRLTHEMYAAGHPPLPSIEIESFARQMPRHWRYLKEKIADSRKRAATGGNDAPPFKYFDEFVQHNHAYLKSSEPAETLKLVERHNHGAAAVILGGVVALREAMELTRDLAEVGEGRHWPELAAFDCTACHHDLKQTTVRDHREPMLRPGRPTLHAWPTALVRLGISHISVDAADFYEKLDEFNLKLRAVQEAFEATPFGDRTKLQVATSDLSRWLTDVLIGPVSEKPFDGKAVRLACRMLVRLVSQDGADFDYDSARQIAWALRTLYCDLDEKPPRDVEIQILFKQLASDLRLDLSNSAGSFCDTTAASSIPRDATRETPAALADSVAADLAAEVRFDAVRFKETMSKFESLLK